MSPHKSSTSSTPVAKGQILRKKKIEAGRKSLKAAEVSRLQHDALVAHHLAQSQVAVDTAAELNTQIELDTSLQFYSKKSASTAKSNNVALLTEMLGGSFAQDVTRPVVVACATLVVEVCLSFGPVTNVQMKSLHRGANQLPSLFEEARDMALKHSLILKHEVDPTCTFNPQYWEYMYSAKGSPAEEA
ncbi:hypothetical protein FRACYDRAFT_244736 [Fragilariopsis cylindrus CCMP1102]|uniref:Uncharacterized protein n=1 Tax=Fragilariopsis cylindrus CCMP1102 TaxID=635003 RepID=A0A1E7F064_9STRA|nr:hypothetical protein FRACYDRAFT_244736 [Fragilariopsis cylindrus CCMP1102]|eukprot:OEU11618.1 hypothetical protein FRACYDRAFT_244736 [Fragilariopsis cylindrus CCMP1102]